MVKYNELCSSNISTRAFPDSTLHVLNLHSIANLPINSASLQKFAFEKNPLTLATMAFPTPQKPISPLGYHRTLAPTCGLKVSPLCLGAMSLGDAWAQGYGAVKKKTAFEIMDHFYEQYVDFSSASLLLTCDAHQGR